MAHFLHYQMAMWLLVQVRNTQQAIEIEPVTVQVGSDDYITAGTFLDDDEITGSPGSALISDRSLPENGDRFVNRMRLCDHVTQWASRNLDVQ
jgi:hypothetical protein